eukprot:TRINITY_DN527_c0_g1_i4.p1 TRINITY_DN527_c0_g1~~TRINITY_DN527_c0_g1_i4.p1  ORF type:complete len:175 (-),score=9.07 TRINITY_DN527_c0_g1_i4:112-636(-)
MVQIESDIHISEHGPLKDGEVAVLGGHNLKCQHVIHAVGPIWNGGYKGEANILSICILNCLTAANGLSYKSIAMPAISTGIFNFPKDLCAAIMFDTVITWLIENPKSNGRVLEEIRFTNFDDETVYIMKTEFEKRFGGRIAERELPELPSREHPHTIESGEPIGESKEDTTQSQ